MRDPKLIAQTDNMCHQLNKMFSGSTFTLHEISNEVDMYNLFRTHPDGRRTVMTTRSLVAMHAFIDGFLAGAIAYIIQSRPYRCVHLQDAGGYKEALPSAPVQAPAELHVVQDEGNVVDMVFLGNDIRMERIGPREIMLELFSNSYPVIATAIDADEGTCITRHFINFEV